MKYLLAFIPAITFASGGHDHRPPPPKPPVAVANAGAVAGSASTATASPVITNAPVVNSPSNAAANNAGVDQSVNFEDRLQTPAVTAPTVFTANPCAIGWSLGAGAPGAGLSGGRTKIDPKCQAALEAQAKAQDIRANIELIARLSPALALKAACLLPGIVEVAGVGDCILPPAPPPPVLPIVPPAPASCTRAISQCSRK